MYLGVSSEIKKIIKYKPLLYVFLILSAIKSYMFIQAAYDLTTINFRAYYISLMLLMLAVLGAAVPVIAGGIVVNGETSWNTWSVSIVNSGRKNLIISKVIALLVICCMLSLLIYSASLLLTFVLGKGDLLHGVVLKTLLQLLAVTFVCFFWGIWSMAISFITKSMAFGVTFSIIYSLMEPIAYQMDAIHGIKKYLPLFNIRGILSPIFSNLANGSILIVPYDDYNHSIYSLILVLFYLFLLLFFFICKYKKYEF